MLDDLRVPGPPAAMYPADAPSEQVERILADRLAAVDAAARATALAVEALTSA